MDDCTLEDFVSLLSDCLAAHKEYKKSKKCVYPQGMVNQSRKKFERELKNLGSFIRDVTGE